MAENKNGCYFCQNGYIDKRVDKNLFKVLEALAVIEDNLFLGFGTCEKEEELATEYYSKLCAEVFRMISKTTREDDYCPHCGTKISNE